MKLKFGNVFAGPLWGAGNHSIKASSMISTFASAHTRQGRFSRFGNFSGTAMSACPAAGPEMRTTAIAAGNRPDERA